MSEGPAPAPAPAPLLLPAHLPELDGLRGIAIALVLSRHTLGGIHLHSIGKLFDFGWAGVDLFFVLSGFLITRMLLRERGTSSALQRFYARRILRIWPLYYGCLLIAILIGPHLPETLSYSRSQHWLSYVLFLQNFRHAAGDSSPWVLGPMWSLAIEEQFYLLWPLAVLKLSLRTLTRLTVAAFLLSPLIRAIALLDGAHSAFVYNFPLCRLDGLAAGAFAALLVHRTSHSAERLARWSRWLALCLVPAIPIIAYAMSGENLIDLTQRPPFALPHILIFSLLAIGFAGLLIWALASSGLQRALHAPLLIWLGKVSYFVYLVHYGLFFLFRAIVPEQLRRWQITGWRATGLAIAATYAVLFVAAALSFRYFEGPILSLKKRFAAR